MPKSLKISLLAASVVVVLCVFLGVNSYGVHAAGDAAQQGAYNEIDVYGEVLQHIQSDYVVTPDMASVTNGALRGLLESLDADSSYLTPADYKAYREDEGGKAQVGINVSKRYGYATVVSVVPGSPADKADLSDGDVIEAIGTEDTSNLSLAMIHLLLEGAPGSELQLAVLRPPKASADKITLNRVIVSEPPVTETMFDNSSILDLRPMVLDKDHVRQVEDKLKAMDKEGNKKILLDLRDVSTGQMPEAIRMANFFLSSGTIATLDGQKFPTQTFAADPAKAINTTAPLVVLVNGGTAGPAEIVAGAIAGNKRGKLVGERTFGEGAEQKTFELPDGAALILTVAKYESPSGKAYEDDAVTPGTLVASAQDDMENGAGANATSGVLGASAAKGEGGKAGKSGAGAGKAVPAKSAAPEPDNQLNKALEMLKAEPA